MCKEPFGLDFHTVLCYSHTIHKLALYTLGRNHMMRIHTGNSALTVEHTHTHTQTVGLIWIWEVFHVQYLQLFNAEIKLHYMLNLDF
jgi:hypothetical protein